MATIKISESREIDSETGEEESSLVIEGPAKVALETLQKNIEQEEEDRLVRITIEFL